MEKKNLNGYEEEYNERLQRLMKVCIEEMGNIGIAPSSNITKIIENTRAKKRLGCCKQQMYNGKKSFTIEISTMLRSETDKIIKEVIIHELLHTCPNCLNHGSQWKEKANKINCKYGYSIKSTAKLDELNLDRSRWGNSISEPAGATVKYKIICKKCGKTIYRARRSKVVARPYLYRCANCGGKLKVKEL